MPLDSTKYSDGVLDVEDIELKILLVLSRLHYLTDPLVTCRANLARENRYRLNIEVVECSQKALVGILGDTRITRFDRDAHRARGRSLARRRHQIR